MKEFNIQNYTTKIFILWIDPSKFIITNNNLLLFFKTFDIKFIDLPKDLLLKTIKYDNFLKIICLLYDNKILNELKIKKIYSDLSLKFEYREFNKNKNNFIINSNINNFIKNNKKFFEDLMNEINIQLCSNKNKQKNLMSFNFNKLVKIFEILFIFPELIDLKNCLLLFTKSLEKDVLIKGNSNNFNPVIKYEDNGGNNNESFFDIDVLINFLLVLSKFFAFKYSKLYPQIKNDSKNLNYLLWYIYYSIEKFMVF